MNPSTTRRIQYKWLGMNWTLDLHPPGDVVSDCFQPPQAIGIYTWLLADQTGTFVDVGAHVGTVAIHAAPFFKDVVAFEPEARNISCLNSNMALNKISNLRIIPKAVSYHCGVSTFYVENSGETSRNSIIPINNSRPISVECVSLDSVFDSTTSIAYLKIDVEGFETQVINGASQIIERQSNKPVIMIEFAPGRWAQNEASFLKFLDLLKKNYYVPLWPTSGFTAPITLEVFHQLYDLWKKLPYDCWVDLVLVPQDRSTPAHIMNAWKKATKIFSKMS